MEMVSTFAKRLREAMQLRGVRAVDICEHTGISKPQISHYLKGTYKPKADAIRKIAQYLRVSEVWLMGYDIDSMERYTTDLEGTKREIMDMLDFLTNSDLEMVKKFIKDYFIDRK